MNSLLFLGTGPGTPVGGRFCSSCLVHVGRSRVLVDAGEPCSRQLVAQSVPVAELDAVLITHGHSDHIGGLPMLLQSAWLAPRERPLPVYLPGELVDPLLVWLEAVYLPPKLLGFPIEFRAWKSGEPVAVSPGVDVAPFPTTHLLGLRAKIDPQATGRFKIFGLDMRCEGCRVVFSSDLGSPADLIPVLSAPCDVLVCELSHFSPEELFAVLKDRPIGQLVFNHLAPDLNGREEDLVRTARRELPQIGRIRAVEDGDRVAF